MLHCVILGCFNPYFVIKISQWLNIILFTRNFFDINIAEEQHMTEQNYELIAFRSTMYDLIPIWYYIEMLEIYW